MGFFWSGPRASIAGIFKRSARYWVTTWVGNCLWGPPGRRGVKNPNHWGHQQWLAAQAVASDPYAKCATPQEVGYVAGKEMGRLGTERGWTPEVIKVQALVLAEQEIYRRFGLRLNLRDRELGLGTVTVPLKPEARPRRRHLAVSRPVGVASHGGLRGGVGLKWRGRG